MSNHVNTVCEFCEVKKPCRDVLKGWREHKTHRPDFVAGIVRFASKNGAGMKCLGGA